jgi:hypothetical protein
MTTMAGALCEEARDHDRLHLVQMFALSTLLLNGPLFLAKEKKRT